MRCHSQNVLNVAVLRFRAFLLCRLAHEIFARPRDELTFQIGSKRPKYEHVGLELIIGEKDGIIFFIALSSLRSQLE